MRRTYICLYLGPADRAELQDLLTSRNKPRKLTWWAGSVEDLEAAIYDYLLLHNAKPRPFVWNKTAEDILAREHRALDHFMGNG